MNTLRTLICTLALCGFAPATFAQDTRALIFRLEAGQYLEIIPNGNAYLSKTASDDPGCNPTGPGFFDFESLYKEVKAAASDKQRSRNDVTVAFTTGGGRAYYVQNRALVLEQYRKARNWIERVNGKTTCPEIPER